MFLMTSFNPCFRGCRSGTRTREHPAVLVARFQSLFSLDVALEQTPKKDIAEVNMFQSLFSWMSLWNIYYWYCHRTILIVSILVFVDVALERDEGVDEAKGYRLGFNPCFRGCRSGTIMSILNDEGGIVFQSLFSWMSLWNTAVGIVCFKPWFKFQSLFSWMSLWNIIDIIPRTQNSLVSILVFVDVALEPYSEDSETRTGYMFQSLFSWMSLWNPVQI